MSHALTVIDQLRIERAVWALDQRLYDLPRKSRIARRRELRDNLRTAATDVGTSVALRNLGDSRALAAEYLSAQFGDGARPSWIAAATFLLLGQLLFTSLLTEAVLAFGDGVTAADPHAQGTFTWEGIRYLQSSVTYTFVDGHGQSVGGAWTPLSWALFLAGAVVIGRLWRFPSTWRRRRRSPQPEVAAAD
jgi:hypothetical protein